MTRLFLLFRGRCHQRVWRTKSYDLVRRYTSRGQKCLLVKQLKFAGQQGVQIRMIWRVELIADNFNRLGYNKKPGSQRQQLP